MKNLIYPVIFVAILLSCNAIAQEEKNIQLPAPNTDGGMPLMQALKLRQTSREFSPKQLPDQQLADLLWAAWGFNRPELKKRTAPSSMNNQEIDLYVIMEKGFYLYDAEKNRLIFKGDKDIREKTGIQEFVRTAPVVLIFVGDYARMGKGSDQQKEVTSNTDAAFISQNVYLFCASEGFNTGVRAYIDKEALHTAMNLTPSQHITLGQCVGFPKEK
jgi:nitroreductase